jgi:SAM-dependent MidA family methyltransferase
VTPLEQIIQREIAQTGPMTVARYMELCLAHPKHGYYITRDPLGPEGDFTTAPEISQLFGEMIGAWVAAVWMQIGRPAVRLVELGPGRGTLMADIMRVMRSVAAIVEVWFIEASPVLREQQRQRVDHAHFARDLSEVPEGPMILIANEFFDALPVHQYLCAEDGWRERVIGLQDDRLTWGLSTPLSDPGRVTPGAWRENSPVADSVLDQIAARLDARPGGALIADYGYLFEDRPKGPTLQAVRDHAFADPLLQPGAADLTWLLDFQHVARRLGRRTKLTEQGAFLAQLGIGQRAQKLAQLNPQQADVIADALERLTSSDQMGRLFKVATIISGGHDS